MTIMYATFRNPEQADQAFVELLERGALPSDLIVITKTSYKEDPTQPQDGRLQPTDEPTDEQKPSSPEFTHDMTAEALLGGHATSHFSPGHARILDTLRFPGDLATALKQIGFTYADAESIETSILHGGGFLVVMTPSGSLDENQAADVISQRGGLALSQYHGGAYAG